MRDLLILVLAVISGILAAYARVGVELLMVAALTLLLGYAVGRTKRRAVGILLLGLLLGVGRSMIYQDTHDFDNKYYVKCQYEGRHGIIDQFSDSGHLIAVRQYSNWESISQSRTLVPGQTVRLSGRFTASAWSLDGILWNVTEAILAEDPSPPSWKERLSRGKLDLAGSMQRIFGHREGALAASLVLGIRDPALSEKQNALKYLGIIHILSISGFHVNLLELILERSRLRRISLPVIVFYAFLIGSVPAWRACLMKGSREAGRILRRDSDAFNQLLTAAFFLLMAAPWYLFSLSFQLTFGATLGLILLQAPLTEALVWLRGGKLKEGLILSASAMIPCVPALSAMSFDVNLALFPANLILVPLYSLCCMAAFLSLPFLLLDLELPLRLIALILGGLCRLLDLLEYVMVAFLSLRVAWTGSLTLVWLWIFDRVLKQRGLTAVRRSGLILLYFAVLHFSAILPGTTRVIFHQAMGQARLVVQQDLRQYVFVSEAMLKPAVARQAIPVEAPMRVGGLLLTPSPGNFPVPAMARHTLAPTSDPSSDIINEEYLWIFGKWIRLK